MLYVSNNLLLTYPFYKIRLKQLTTAEPSLMAYLICRLTHCRTIQTMVHFCVGSSEL